MKLRYKIIAVVGIVLGFVTWLHFDRPVKTTPFPVQLTLPQVKAVNEALHMPDYGHGVVVKNVHGKSVIVPKAMGFPFDVGASLAIGPQVQLYLTTEVFFYRHFELLAGAGCTFPILHPRVMGAIGYRLPWKHLDNLSLFVGGTSAEEVIAGMYWRFGSN